MAMRASRTKIFIAVSRTQPSATKQLLAYSVPVIFAGLMRRESWLGVRKPRGGWAGTRPPRRLGARSVRPLVRLGRWLRRRIARRLHRWLRRGLGRLRSWLHCRCLGWRSCHRIPRHEHVLSKQYSGDRVIPPASQKLSVKVKTLPKRLRCVNSRQIPHLLIFPI